MGCIVSLGLYQPSAAEAEQACDIPDQVQAVSLIAASATLLQCSWSDSAGNEPVGEASLVQAGGAYVEHALFATPYFPEGTSPRIRAFSEKYRRIYWVGTLLLGCPSLRMP